MDLTLLHPMTTFDGTEERAFETNVGKGGMLVTSFYSVFHNVFYPVEGKFDNFRNIKF